MTLNVDYLPKIRAEYVRHQYQVLSSKPRHELAAKSLRLVKIVPLGVVEDAWMHPGPNMVVDDLDWCADIISDVDGPVEDVRVAYCGFLHNHAWGHFLTNTMSRLWVVTTMDQEIDRYVFYTNNTDGLSGNFREAFQLLGILDKVEILSGPKTYREVVVPDLSFALDQYSTPEYVAIFDLMRNRAMQGHGSDEPRRRVFFTRSSWKNAKRDDIGLLFIDDFYWQNGFEVVAPEQLSLTEMIRLLANSSVVALISGSGAHNSVFIPAGCEVQFIERSSICNIFQPIVEMELGHKLVYVQASYSLLPVAYGSGPFYYALTPYLAEFAKAHNYQVPAVDERRRLRDFKRYLRRRNSLFSGRWWIDTWANDQLEVFNEGYAQALADFSSLLGGNGVVNQSWLCRLQRVIDKIFR